MHPVVVLHEVNYSEEAVKERESTLRLSNTTALTANLKTEFINPGKLLDKSMAPE